MYDIRKLKSMPYAQCHIEFMNGVEDKNNLVFFSYVTPVIVVVDGWLSVRGLYSQTTRKQIGKFMSELYGLSYQSAKQLYEDGYEMNVETGEVREY